ncbi:hypothetical protein BJ546DRAFT_135949 [Cryomyces antarcticus]
MAGAWVGRDEVLTAADMRLPKIIIRMEGRKQTSGQKVIRGRPQSSRRRHAAEAPDHLQLARQPAARSQAYRESASRYIQLPGLQCGHANSKDQPTGVPVEHVVRDQTVQIRCFRSCLASSSVARAVLDAYADYQLPERSGAVGVRRSEIVATAILMKVPRSRGQPGNRQIPIEDPVRAAAAAIGRMRVSHSTSGL